LLGSGTGQLGKNAIEQLNAESPVDTPSLDREAIKRGLQNLKESMEERELSFSDFGGNNDDWNDGDDDGDDDEDEDGDEDEAYLEEKLELAASSESILTEARIIFQKDSGGNVFMVARLDDIDLPEHFSSIGDEMFESDIIFQLGEKTFINPKKIQKKINGSLFKKKNWKGLEF